MSEHNSERHFEKGYRPLRTPSMFGPIVLIALGAGLLLANLGLLPAINWGLLWQLWPLLLILWGINLLVRQVPQPFGAFLSALVGLATVGIMVYVAFWGDRIPGLEASPSEAGTIRTGQVVYPAAGLEGADITLEFNQFPAEVNALAATTPQLLEGQMVYTGELIFETQPEGERAEVTLDTREVGWWFLNPANWAGVSGPQRSALGLNPTVPLNLRFDLGSGATELNLADLTLEGLQVNGGSGRWELQLPPGTGYDPDIEVGSGALELTLPAEGNYTLRLEGGSGSSVIVAPAGLQLRLEVQEGSGVFRADERFTRVGADGEESIWETAGYAEADQRLDLILDVGSGSVTVREP